MNPDTILLRVTRIVACALFAATACVAHAQSAKANGSRECGPPPLGAMCPPQAWMAFSRMDVTLKLGNYRSDYVLLLTDSHDIYASYYEQTADEKVRGEAVLLGGQVLTVKTDVVDGIRDLRAIDIPLSVGELATVLLGAAIPDGPSTITGPRTIKAADRERFVLAPTSTGGSLYGPPWQMSGKVRRTSATAIGFDLKFTFRQADAKGELQKGPPITMQLVGTADYPAKRDDLPDSFNLSGWKFTTPGTETITAVNLGEARKIFNLR
jgi:hypothetical protein